MFFGWLGVVRVRQETRKKLGWALGHMGNRSLGSSFGQWVWLWKHARQRRQWEQLGLPGAAMALLYEAQGIAPSAAVAAAAAMERRHRSGSNRRWGWAAALAWPCLGGARVPRRTRLR